MKKIIIGIFILCFCSVVNAATATYPTDGYYPDAGEKPKGKWLGKIKTGAKVVTGAVAAKKAGKIIKYGVGGAVVVTGTAILGKKAYDYLSLNDHIARKLATDDPDSTVVAHLSERITNDLNNPKKNHIDVIMEAKDELEYYIIRYPNTKYSQRAIDVAIETGLYDPAYKERLNTKSKAYENIKSRLKVNTKRIERENPVNCGYAQREVIKNVMPITPISTQHVSRDASGNLRVAEWDTGAYKVLRNHSKPDTRENDHIPSKATVMMYIMHRDYGGGKLPTSVELEITKNASAVNIEKTLHEDGRTMRDQILYKQNYTNLSEATIDDFSWHYINSDYNPKVLVALDQVYLRNQILCLYQ